MEKISFVMVCNVTGGKVVGVASNSTENIGSIWGSGVGKQFKFSIYPVQS